MEHMLRSTLAKKDDTIVKECIQNSMFKLKSDAKHKEAKKEEQCQCPKTKGVCDAIQYVLFGIKAHAAKTCSDYLTIYKAASNKCDADTLEQIDKDIIRTYCDEKFLTSESSRIRLKRLLITISNYDNKIGYVQGMSYIAGSLLYHCSEEMSYWIFTQLLDSYSYNEVFLPKFPGIFKHCAIIELLFQKYFPKLYGYLVFV